MCIRERKTYIHSDGERTVEKLRLCHRAVGERPCNRIERRNTEPIRVVEVRPPTERNSSDGLLVTEGFNGRQTRYRDVSIRSSNSSSLRRSMTMSDNSPPVSFPSSITSSPSIVEVKPEAPSPPPAVPGYPFRTRTQSPAQPMGPSTPPFLPRDHPAAPPDPFRIVTPDGHAIYDRPPSLELPRAINNERMRPPRPREQASASSMRAEVDNDNGPNRRQPSPPPASRTADPPRRRRRDSQRHSDAGIGSSRGARRPDRPIIDQQDPPPQPETEDERQARLERSRLAETDRRQPARDQLARDASRERHRREAAEALERGAGPSNRNSIQENIAAEFEQMEREKAAAAESRRRDSNLDAAAPGGSAEATRRFAEDYVYRGTDGRIRYVTERTSTTNSPRHYDSEEAFAAPTTTTTTYPGPSSPRQARNPPPPVALHQPYAARRRSNTFRDRGEEVIAREQARAATERLSEALGDAGGVREEDEGVEEYDVVVGADGHRYRRYRRRRDGGGRRDRPPRQFWR